MSQPLNWMEIMQTQQPLPLHKYHLILNVLLLAFLWGPSFLFIKLAVVEISPTTLVALRITLSTAFMLLLLKIKKIPLPRDKKLWKHCFFMGFIATSVPFILYGYSLRYIDSILSALINGTTPICTVLLANYFLKDEPFTINRVTGILLGLIGFSILFIPPILEGKMTANLWGIVLSFAAACCYAIGMVYARKNIKPLSKPLILPTLQLLTSTIFLIPFALWVDPPLNLTNLSLKVWGSIIGLSVLGTVLAFITYYKIVIHHGATALSSVTYILPIFSTFFGVLFLNEQISASFCAAALLILFGTMVTNGLVRLPFSTQEKRGLPH
jgi:drug/metabolite transporter (DMT)-like permease